MGICCSQGKKPNPNSNGKSNIVCSDNYLDRTDDLGNRSSSVSLQSSMEVFSVRESTVSYDEDQFPMEEAVAGNGLDHREPQHYNPITPNGLDQELQTCEPSSSKDEWQYTELRVFTYQELATATDRFSNNNSLGEGGFAQVFKGTGLPITEKVVAIKKLKFKKGQRENDFEKEIRVISSASHRNLVKLFGYCNEKANKLLVLEYVPNNSLGTHLHGGEGNTTLKWQQRIKIAIGSAKGLEYLHDDCKPKIIHRDIKTDNILLDAKLNPKVADFGLAKIFPDSVSITHITSQWKGTEGYTDPTDYPSQKVSDKLDVYSFGVVLLELVSGRRPISEGVTILDWARTRIDKALKSGDYTSLLDPKLDGDYDKSELKRLILCAAASVFKPSQCRPQMKQIVQALEGYLPLKAIWDVDDKTFLHDCLSQHVHHYQQKVLDHPMSIKEPTIDDIEYERLQNYHPRRFTFQELAMASDDFSNSNLLRKSEFCQVYMGVLPSGERVEIKYLKFWTALQEGEFEKDIKAMISVRHRNVVKLVGYCMSRDRRLLVSEFVPNTLRSRLHGNNSMDWIARMKIAKGCARGLKHLLEDCNPRIIHQDFNPDHIFLDDKLEPILGDFASSQLFPDSVISIPTYPTYANRISGYTAPECVSTRQLTDTSNVYSYGVLLLELITGVLLDNYEVEGIRWQLKMVLNKEKNDVPEYNHYEMVLLSYCAASCLREDPISRPKMSQIVGVLEGTISLRNFWEWNSRWTRL